MSQLNYRLQARITKLYMDMRLKRLSRLNWMMETEAVIEALLQIDHLDVAPELFYAQLLITKEAYEAAGEQLDLAADWLRGHSSEAPACHAYYLYLTTLLEENEVLDEKVTVKLKELSSKYPSIWQISWLLYYMDKDLAAQPLEQYHFLKRMFLRGCRSPILYLEARVLLERNPTFLYEFSEFEVQLVMFMIRHAGISDRVAEVLAEYMLTRTDYRYLYVMILQGCYEVTPSKRILESICRMMILGGCAGDKFTGWYRRGISGNVRLPGLFEAFLRSMPVEDWFLDGEELSDERRIPTEVVEYFAHAAGPDIVRMAYLYAVVHKYKENWFSLYKLYEPLLQPFLLDCLFKGIINPGLAYLYEHLLEVDKLPGTYMETFLMLCHTYKVTGLPIEAGTFVLRYTHHKEPVRVPFTGWMVMVPIFGREYTYTVENYSGSELSVYDAEMIPMLRKEIWDSYLAEQNIENLYYHMARVEAAMELHCLEQHVPHVKRVFDSEVISEELKEAAAEQILPYWDINGVYEEILAAAPFVFAEFGSYSKNKEVRFWKKQYMQNHIGIYGMQFLLDYDDGPLQEKGGLFTKAHSLGIETGGFAEQLLHDMLEAGLLLPQHVQIMEACCRSVDNPALIKQYIEFVAEKSFLEQSYPDTAVLAEQAVLTVQGITFDTISKLAYLQSLAAGGAASQGQQLTEVAGRYLAELLQADIYMSWMQPLRVFYPGLSDWEAYQVLEYRGHFSGPVWVRYTSHNDGKNEAESLRSEVMEQACEGVYTRKFILFYGERIHYEIFGLDGTEQRALGQGVLQGGSTTGSVSKFARLNRMLSLREKHENLEMYGELEQYYGQSAIVQQIFKLR